MITAAQMRAARALLGIDQRTLAALSALSLPTIQRMEASDGVVRGNVDSLMKLVGALYDAGIELISEDGRVEIQCKHDTPLVMYGDSTWRRRPLK